jgi:Fe-S cluster assembly protein SufB
MSARARDTSISTEAEYAKRYGFHEQESEVFRLPKGLSEDFVRQLSKRKGEPQWMLDFRLNALKAFMRKPLPPWGADLSAINFDEITYYIKPTEKPVRRWEDVPEHIKRTFERLGVPEAERKFLAGVGAQYESEAVYHSLKEELATQGVIFTDMDSALKEHPDLVRRYFATVVPPEDNKFAALNSALWSGGSFVYVPKGVKVDIPLQAYFRINARSMGQFERTLIIVEEGAKVHYVEGCTAPVYHTQSLHAAVVEVICQKNSTVRYTTIQNWSGDVYNLVTKRAVAYDNAVVEWIDGNLGSKTTMKYPCVVLKGPGARADVLSVALAGKGQHQDAGAKVIHLAPNTRSRIINKSVSKDGGRSSYRGLVRVGKEAANATVSVQCGALILDDRSRSDTYPLMKVERNDATIVHEATCGRVSQEKLFYLMQRGLEEEQAMALVVLGFIAEFTKTLPMEYAIELNRLIELEMEGLG